MEKVKYQDKTPEERVELLIANCYSTEKQDDKFYFTDDELDQMREALSEHVIKKDDLEAELKHYAAGIRASIKTENTEIKTLLKLVKDKFEIKPIDVYHFDDQETGVMETYNAQGELIGTRRLRPHERQTRIVELNQKTA